MEKVVLSIGPSKLANGGRAGKTSLSLSAIFLS
jgi:hypothetical protein